MHLGEQWNITQSHLGQIRFNWTDDFWNTTNINQRGYDPIFDGTKQNIGQPPFVVLLLRAALINLQENFLIYLYLYLFKPYDVVLCCIRMQQSRRSGYKAQKYHVSQVNIIALWIADIDCSVYCCKTVSTVMSEQVQVIVVVFQNTSVRL